MSLIRKHHRFGNLQGKIWFLFWFGDSGNFVFKTISRVSLSWDGNSPAGVSQSASLGDGAWKGWKSEVTQREVSAGLRGSIPGCHSWPCGCWVRNMGQEVQSLWPPLSGSVVEHGLQWLEKRVQRRRPGRKSVSPLLSVQELSECACLCSLIRFVSLFTLP